MSPTIIELIFSLVRWSYVTMVYGILLLIDAVGN